MLKLHMIHLALSNITLGNVVKRYILINGKVLEVQIVHVVPLKFCSWKKIKLRKLGKKSTAFATFAHQDISSNSTRIDRQL